MPGTILYSEYYSVWTISTGELKRSKIAGPDSEGYKEGYFGEAKFKWIASFFQLNLTTLLVMDSGNHCLCFIVRISGRTSRLQGMCGISGFQNGLDARFHNPYTVILDTMEENQLLLLDNENACLRSMNRINLRVSTLKIFDPSDKEYSNMIQLTNGNSRRRHH